MNDSSFALSDCRTFGQVLRMRPPRFVHQMVGVMLLTLIAVALLTVCTNARLVVLAAGRVRPTSRPVDVFTGERFSSEAGARVVEVRFQKGGLVQKGQVLIRLDAAHLDNQIAKLTRTIEASTSELRQLRNVIRLTEQEFETANAKAASELEAAKKQWQYKQEHHALQARLAYLSWDDARDQHQRNERIRELNRSGISDRVLFESQSKLAQATKRLEAAQMPLEDNGIQMAQHAATLTARRHQVRREELNLQRVRQQSRVETAQLDLQNLQLARAQAEIRCPVDGVVVTDAPKRGDVIPAGKPFAQVARQDGFRFQVEVDNHDIGRLHVGMPARIKLNAFDYRQFGTLPGRVVFVSPDSKLAAEPFQVTSAATYLVEIQLDKTRITSPESTGSVLLGMTGQAEIVTGRESLLRLLTKRVHQSIRLM